MAYYLVRANLRDGYDTELESALAHEQFVDMKPFGKALTMGLRGMRYLPDQRVAWEEEDYCTPPLRMEREAVLDRYFTSIEVELVAQDEGWKQLEGLRRVFTQLK